MSDGPEITFRVAGETPIPVDENGDVDIQALGMNAAPQDAANALLDAPDTVAVPAEEYDTPAPSLSEE